MHIRSLTRDDFCAIVTWFPDEAALVQWGGPDVTFPLDESQLDTAMAEGIGERPRRRLWIAELDASPVAHAQVVLDWRHGVARLARVCVAPTHRGSGLALPFLRRVIDATFAEPIFERLELNVYTFNAPAIRTYEKLGFIAEGVRRSSVRVGGERWDTAMFGLLRSEKPRYAM
jgi:RimJ/RimL family protein N-acetyltransferase